MKRLVFAITGATQIPGGVSGVNLNILHALTEISSESNLAVKIMSLNEDDAARPEFVPNTFIFKGYRGNKFRFAADLVKEITRNPLYLFDYVRLTSPIIPFMVTGLARSIIFAHGVEYWKRSELRTIDKSAFS